MARMRFELRQCIVSAGQLIGPSRHLLGNPLSRLLSVGSFSTESTCSRQICSIPELQEAGESETRWHELPPVPKQGAKWTSWELNKAMWTSDQKLPDGQDEERGMDSGVKQITALQWVSKCCPSLPSSLLHKLFRLRQVRQRTLMPATEHQELPVDSPVIEQAATRMRRVAVKAVLEEGAVLCLPRSVLHQRADVPPGRDSKKIQHEATAAESAWLQSLVLYKDVEILVISKPPGLPVQGGSQIKKSLDSLMGTALSFDYTDGPRLVHRLDKETSGLLILARTQESAMLLHTLFREKTAAAKEAENDNTIIKRVYWALVIGIPRRPQGRISSPLIKVVLDDGKVDKIMVSHDLSNEMAQVAITDYKVIGPSYHGCTWLELHPVTGRKHQLRVHCAEVLGTPVFGDMKYGWRTQKEWLRETSLHNSQTKGGNQVVNGSIQSKDPLLHLHCKEVIMPNVSQMLEMDRSRLGCADVNIDRLQFVAPLPPHMAASRNI